MVKIVLRQTGNALNELINDPDDNGDTGLHLSCSCICRNKLKNEDRINISKTLVKAGANPCLLNKKSYSAFDVLFQCHCCPKFDILRFLLENFECDMSSVIYSLCKTFSLPGRLTEKTLTDMQKCFDILFEEKATAFAALQKCISFNTDPNLLLHLLVQHFDSFSVSEKSEILDHCLQERHLLYTTVQTMECKLLIKRFK